MSRDTDRSAWRVTTDHQQIVTWADEHDVVPVRVEQSGGVPSVDVATDPAAGSGERLSWDEFFEHFEAEQLAVRYREPAADESGPAVTEVVVREGAAERTAADEKVVDPDDTATEQIGASDTGEGEPVVFDAVESDGDTDGDDTAEAAGGAEASGLVLDEIHEAPGPDSGAEDEYLVFRNDGDATLDLSGWTVTNDVGRSYVFPENVPLDVGERITLRSGHGEDDESTLYWGAGETVWDDTGDIVTVETASGRRVLREPYKGG